jgi:methionyl aminopeptidase
MAITIKSRAELNIMRTAGRITAETLALLREMVQPGITTKDLDRAAYKAIKARGAEPSFKGYQGFPGSICASVNNEVVHAIPGKRVLHEGDIIKIDLGVYYRGYHGDATITVPVGKISAETQRLLRVCETSLWRGIEQARVGNRLGDISHAIQSYVESQGFSVVRDYGGHGIGRELHEDPHLPHYGPPGHGVPLRAGMVLTIEPMINAGSKETRKLDDGWTVVTADGSLSAQFEHTVAITENGPEVFTLLE